MKRKIESTEKPSERPIETKKAITIPAPNIQRIKFRIIGTAPYMQSRFSRRQMGAFISSVTSGEQRRKGGKRAERDTDQMLADSTHITTDGWNGIPAPAFRNAMIDACRMCGFKMTVAKMSVFVDADGYDVDDATPLVRIYGKSEKSMMAGRNKDGSPDLRVRPLWRAWHCDLTVRYSADQFSAQDVANLLLHAGVSVGVGCGRPFSRDSAGIDFGKFTIENGDGKR